MAAVWQRVEFKVATLRVKSIRHHMFHVLFVSFAACPTNDAASLTDDHTRRLRSADTRTLILRRTPTSATEPSMQL